MSSGWSFWRAGGVLAGKMGAWVDYGSVWSPKKAPRWRYVGPKLEPCCGFGVSKSSVNLSSSWNLFFSDFEAGAGWPEKHFVS